MTAERPTTEAGRALPPFVYGVALLANASTAGSVERAQHSYPEDDVTEAVNAERRRIAEAVRKLPYADLHAVLNGKAVDWQTVDRAEVFAIIERQP